jgi:hypothetical protein
MQQDANPKNKKKSLCLNKRHAIQMRVDVGFSFFTHSQSGQQM